MTLWLSLIAVVCFVGLAQPTTSQSTFYVDAAHGSDTNSGRTAASAFATAQRALAAIKQARGPTQVLLAGGFYGGNETLIFDASASHTSWTATGQGLPIISGGMRIGQWTRVAAPSPRIRDPSASASPAPVWWRAQLPTGVAPFTDVYLDREALRPARLPNFGQYYIWADALCDDLHAKPPPPCYNQARYGFVYNNSDIDPQWPATEPNAQVIVYHGWSTSRHWLKSVFPANRTVFFDNPANWAIGYWANHDSEGGGRYFVENIAAGLDEEGEWYYNVTSGQLTILLNTTVDPNTTPVYVPQHDRVVQVLGATNITFWNLSFRHNNFICNKTMICDYQSTSWQTNGAIEITNASNIVLNHCELNGVGSYAVWITEKSQQVAVTANDFSQLAAGAIRVGTAEAAPGPYLINISDNQVLNGGLRHPDGTPIFIQKAANVTITHNEAGYFSYAGISVGWSWNFADPSYTDNVTVMFNHVHDLGTGLRRQLSDAMAAVYTLGVLNNTVVSHNLLHDVYAWYTGGYCLSQDQGSSHILFESNICYATTGASQTQHYGLGNIYRNNIFANAMQDSWTPLNSPGIRSVPQVVDPTSFTFVNNIVYATNDSNFLFMGDYTILNSNVSQAHQFTFERNVYWNTASKNLAAEATWGGCNGGEGVCDHGKLTWPQWRQGCGTDEASNATHCTGPKMDAGSLIADPQFADPGSHNFTLLPSSPAFALGFQQIDLTTVGPRVAPGPTL